MTIEEIADTGRRAHDRAESRISDEQTAAWMQVKMLSEIALQLALMNGETAAPPGTVSEALLGTRRSRKAG